jgi:hypothetical protein
MNPFFADVACHPCHPHQADDVKHSHTMMTSTTSGQQEVCSPAMIALRHMQRRGSRCTLAAVGGHRPPSAVIEVEAGLLVLWQYRDSRQMILCIAFRRPGELPCDGRACSLEAGQLGPLRHICSSTLQRTRYRSVGQPDAVSQREDAVTIRQCNRAVHAVVGMLPATYAGTSKGPISRASGDLSVSVPRRAPQCNVRESSNKESPRDQGWLGRSW